MTTTTRPPDVKRGDVVLAVFPNSDMRTAKPRPCLIVQADNLGTGLSQVVVAMITSRLNRAGHPSRVLVHHNSDVGRRSGLLTDSVVVTDNLATIVLRAIYQRIGELPMDDVNRSLRHTLDL